MKPVSPVILGCGKPEVVFGKNQTAYLPLPALRTEDGMVITRWSLSIGERLRVLFSGSLWLLILTANRPLQPVKLDTRCPVIEDDEA